MSYVAAGVVVAGVATSAYGSIVGGQAASKAAQEQQDAAEQFKKYVQGQQDKATGMVLTPHALAAHDQALSAQEGNVRRLETLAANIDPALIDAGKQTAQLLQGKSAPVLANIQNQRNLQRQQMMDNLRSQLGPGAETSSAGQQAMQKFDNDTANMMSTTQQQYLSQVSNLAISGSASLGDTLNRVNSTLDTINNDGPQEQAAKLIAQFTNPGAQAQEMGVNAAGGEQKGKQLQGQMLGQIGGAMVQGAAASAGNRLGGTTPTAPGSDSGIPMTPAQDSAAETAGGFAPGSFSAERQRIASGGTSGGFGNVSGAGTLASVVNAPAAPRSVGAGVPAAPSYLPMSSNYGGGGNANYNINPRTMPYMPVQLGDLYNFGTQGRPNSIAGGN